MSSLQLDVAVALGDVCHESINDARIVHDVVQIVVEHEKAQTKTYREATHQGIDWRLVHFVTLSECSWKQLGIRHRRQNIGVR